MHLIRLSFWATQRGRSLNDFPELIRGRTALVNIDMQSVFLDADQIYGNPHGRDIIPAVNALSAATRAREAPVIWTRNTHTSEGPCAPASWQYDISIPEVAAGVAALQVGTASHDLYPDMDVAPSDVVIDKYRYGALSCPAGALRRTLEGLDVEMVLLTGVLTNLCCETTARELNMAGYKVIVIADAMATLTDAEHNAALLNLRLNFADVRRTKAVLRMIRRDLGPG